MEKIKLTLPLKTLDSTKRIVVLSGIILEKKNDIYKIKLDPKFAILYECDEIEININHTIDIYLEKD